MNNATTAQTQQMQEGQDIVTRFYIATRLRHHLAPLVENNVIELNGTTYSGYSYEGKTEVTISASSIYILSHDFEETHDLLSQDFWYYQFDEMNAYRLAPHSNMDKIDALCAWNANKIRQMMLE
jgi:hypothetical protein